MISEAQARKYCYEGIRSIDNYDKAVRDKEHIWHCHHRVETIMNCGKKELIQKGCYYHRPAHELIFLRHDVHMSLHVKGNESRYRKMLMSHIGTHLTPETKSKISNALRGRFNNPAYSKQVLMKRVSDGLVKEFPSMAEARRWLKAMVMPKPSLLEYTQPSTVEIVAHTARSGLNWTRHLPSEAATPRSQSIHPA